MSGEPKWLGRAEASAYLTMKRASFNRAVRDGVLPAGSAKLGERAPKWDVSILDAAMRGDDVKASDQGHVNDAIAKIRAKSRTNRKTRPVGRNH